MKIKTVRKDTKLIDWGCNPCSEIILRDKAFCNLTEVVIRSTDDAEAIKQKVKLATILGTIQASLTDFHFISSEWRTNCEEEALLGVSLTGIYDNVWTSNSKKGVAFATHDFCGDEDETLKGFLGKLRELTNEVNEDWAIRLGIAPSAATTCVKPSGTVSQLVDSASGIHPRYSRYYIRNVRMDIKDPVCQFLQAWGIPSEPDVNFPDSQLVFSFPCAAPDGAVCRKDISALEHLKLWKVYQDAYCEHKPSVTISVKDDEWMGVGAWVFENFADISGISFLPYSEHTYIQAPYIEITKVQYEEMCKTMPQVVPWEELVENHDDTTASQEYACSGDKCELP